MRGVHEIFKIMLHFLKSAHLFIYFFVFLVDVGISFNKYFLKERKSKLEKRKRKEKHMQNNKETEKQWKDKKIEKVKKKQQQEQHTKYRCSN